MSDVRHEPADVPATSTFLAQIEQESPFEPGGHLPRHTRALLLSLDAVSLGRGITSLLHHTVALSVIDRSGATATIDALINGGGTGPIPSESDVAVLIAMYRDHRGDPGRQAIIALIVSLLRNADRATIFASIGVDAASLDLRARMTQELAGPPTGAAPDIQHAASSAPPTRGMRFDAPAIEQIDDDERGGELAAVEAIGAGELAAPQANGGGELAALQANGGSGHSAVGPAPGAQPRTYRAYGLLESDETVLVARPFELKVGLSPSSPPGVAGPPLELPRPNATAYPLDIQLFADGFDLAPGETWRHSLLVAADHLYPSVVVHLTARDLPEPKAIRSITATFSIGGETLGAATRQIIVTTDPNAIEVQAPAVTATGTNITAPTGQPAADITITIHRGLEAGALLWGVESNLPGVAFPHDGPARSDLGNDPKEFATAIIRKLFVQGSQLGVFQLLQGIGKTIRDEIPVAVRTALNAANAAVAPRPLDILLLTEEPYVPWELAWVDEPFDPTAPRYLGAQANIGRWVLDGGATPTDPPRSVLATTMAVVSGVYKSAGLPRLLAAEEEAKQIQERYLAAPIDAQPNEVYSLLGGMPPSDILHFAVHGRYNPQGADEGIYLVSGPPIDPLQIRGSDLTSRAPFVFLNACQVGAAQNLLGSYGGIAQAFLQIGASAVVAPLWSIDDKIAQQIALEFYKEALDPADDTGGDGIDARERPSVADLLRRARAGLVEHAAAQSSTYLAYQFYGHPSLRLSWKPSTTAGGPLNG
jgi:CHAT domain-containing protein